MAEKLQFVLYYYKTYPTFDGLAMPFGMARSKAHENLHKLSPILYDTLVHLELMPGGLKSGFARGGSPPH